MRSLRWGQVLRVLSTPERTHRFRLGGRGQSARRRFWEGGYESDPVGVEMITTEVSASVCVSHVPVIRPVPSPFICYGQRPLVTDHPLTVFAPRLPGLSPSPGPPFPSPKGPSPPFVGPFHGSVSPTLESHVQGRTTFSSVPGSRVTPQT